VQMTRFGGECYAFAMLAAGQIDLCLEPSLQPYDIVALIPIIERAGGVVSDLRGNRAENGGAILASANARIHEAALRVLNS
ncbi:MAG: inositol monophosphatase, partial [Mesorhizobium sp.]